jgi:peptide/nickel transport system substrate-binding protein
MRERSTVRRSALGALAVATIAAAAVLVVPGLSRGSSKAPAVAPADTAIVAQSVDPTTMDPQNQRETTTFNVLTHFYDPLIMRDTKNPKTFDGVLATSFKRISPTVMRFTLHKGVKFDDGSAFDANTVKYNVDRIMGTLPGEKTQPLSSFQYTSLKSAKVVNPTTVDIITKTPDPLLLARLSALLIIPTGSVDKDQNALAAKPNGTGPYSFVEWDRNNQVVMKAKPDYFRGKPNIANVIFKDMPDASSRLAALESGDVDVISNLPPDNVPEVKSSGKANVDSVPSARITSIWLNTLDEKPLKSAKVRQALNYAVDVNTIIKKVMDGYALRTATIVPPYFSGYSKSIKPFPYNPTKAKQLLKQAGYANGFPLTLMVPKGRYLLGEDIAQAVVGYLGKVGVKAKVNIVDFGVFAKTTQERKIPSAFFAGWGENFFSPIDEAQVAIQCGTKGFSWYCNKKVDKLINRAAETLDQKKQNAIIVQMQREILKSPVFIYLFAYKDIYGVSKRLVWTPRTDETIYMYEASLKK